MVQHDATKFTIFAYEHGPEALSVLKKLSTLGGAIANRLNYPIMVRVCSANEITDTCNFYKVSRASIFLVVPSRQVIEGPALIDYLLTDGVSAPKRQFGYTTQQDVNKLPIAPSLQGPSQIAADPLSIVGSIAGGGDEASRVSTPAATFDRPSFAGGQQVSMPQADSAPMMGPISDSPGATQQSFSGRHGGGGGGGGNSQIPSSVIQKFSKASSNTQLARLKEGTSSFVTKGSQLKTLDNNSVGDYFTMI